MVPHNRRTEPSATRDRTHDHTGPYIFLTCLYAILIFPDKYCSISSNSFLATGKTKFLSCSCLN